LVLAFTDNLDAADSDYTITFNEVIQTNSWEEIEALDKAALDDVRSHNDIDYPVAIKVPENLTAGTYIFTIDIIEDGDPWENSRTVELKVIINEFVEEDSTE
jgi:hypothetical protein